MYSVLTVTGWMGTKSVAMMVKVCPTRDTVYVFSTDGLMRRTRCFRPDVRVKRLYEPPPPGLTFWPLKRTLSLGGGAPGKPGMYGVLGLFTRDKMALTPA